MKQKQINYPEIKNNDIKVLGRVVSIASANRVAAAEQVFDEKFNYDLIGDYSWDNIIDATRSEAGMDQYTINRLFGKKLKKFDDAFQFDEDGWLLELKVRNLIADNATINNKLTTKDLEVTNNATIKNLHVTENSTFDGNVTIGGNLIANNKNIGDLIEQILRVISGDDKTSEIWRIIQDHESRIRTLEACCEDMHNNPTGGVSLSVNPDPINITVGDPDVAFTVKASIGLSGNYTAQIVNTSVATLVGGKVHAVAEGNTQLKIDWQGIQKTVLINVAAPAPVLYTITYMDDTSIITTEDYEAGATIDPLHGQSPLTKEGYTFAGWDGMPSDMKMPANDITVIAQWTQNEQPVEPIRPESISISGPNAVQVGNTITLTATITPSNADTDTAITWNSSDESKATVNNGVVTGVAEGATTITARTANGKTTSHQVTVTAIPTPTEYSLTPSFDYWEFKLGTYPTSKTLTLTLNGWENGTVWDLKRSDNPSFNAHTSIGTDDQLVTMAETADSPTGRQITFSAYIDNEKVGETTVTIVTLPADEPTHNTFTATFFDTGLGADETDPYVYGSNPNLDYPVGPSYYDNPVVLGTVEFTEGELSGVWHEAKEGWPTEEEVKAKCLAAGVDRTGYKLRWDSASYAGYMPNRDIYIKAVWDVDETPKMFIRSDMANHILLSDGTNTYTDDNEYNQSVRQSDLPRTFTVSTDDQRWGYNIKVYGETWPNGSDSEPVSVDITSSCVNGNTITVSNFIADGRTHMVIELVDLNPDKFIVYKTNVDDALYINYGSSGAGSADRRLTFDDFTTPCQMVTIDGIHNTPISIGGDEAATFFTLPGYEISDVSVVWDGEEPSWVTTEGHNQYADPVTIQYNRFSGSFRVVEGLKSGATVTITLTAERHPEILTSDGTSGTDEIDLFVGESEDYLPTLRDVPADYTLKWESDLIGTCYTLETIGDPSFRGGTDKIRIKALASTEGVGDLGNSSNPSIDVIDITLLDKDGNQVYDTNSSGEAYPVTAMLRVAINPDPIVTVEWDTDEHVTLSNTSSENGVEEFEPITLDENGDAVYHNWTADMNVDSGYKIKSTTVLEFHGVSQINNTPDYRTWYGGKDITDDSITLTANGLKYTGPYKKVKITVTTEEV